MRTQAPLTKCQGSASRRLWPERRDYDFQTGPGLAEECRVHCVVAAGGFEGGGDDAHSNDDDQPCDVRQDRVKRRGCGEGEKAKEDAESNPLRRHAEASWGHVGAPIGHGTVQEGSVPVTAGTSSTNTSGACTHISTVARRQVGPSQA